MRASTLLNLYKSIDALGVDHGACSAFKKLLCEAARVEGIDALAREERVLFAQHLLAMRVSRPTIRDRLSVRYGISSKQAYRVINEAMRLGQRSSKNVPPEFDNGINRN